MTRSPIVLALFLASSTAFAETPAKDLRADEIRERVKSADDAISQCYLGAVAEKTGNGKLDITLEIHRKGIVDKITVSAPGVPAKLAKKIDTCVHAALAGVEFPARRFGTIAVVPYFYQRLPKAGPYESCWNAKGCPTHDEAPSTSTRQRVAAKS